MDLWQRRATIIAEHQAQEKFDPYWKAEAAAGRKLSERPIAFLCDDEVRLFGECISKVHAGLEKFLVQVEALPDHGQARANEPTFVAAVKLARLCTTSPPGNDSWSFPQQRWNSITYALAQAGIEIVITEGTYLPSE